MLPSVHVHNFAALVAGNVAVRCDGRADLEALGAEVDVDADATPEPLPLVEKGNTNSCSYRTKCSEQITTEGHVRFQHKVLVSKKDVSQKTSVRKQTILVPTESPIFLSWLGEFARYCSNMS